MTVYYQDDYVTVHHGSYQSVLPTLERVQHVICDPPYSEHVHGAARSQRMVSSNDRGGKYGADVRRNVELGFDHLAPEDLYFLSEQFARLAERWVLVFSDTESSHLWADGMEKHGLDYVRTGAWIKVGSTPQFSGDRPATGFEAITIMHPPGRKRWNGGGKHAVWTHAIVLNRSRSTHPLDGRFHTTQKPMPLMSELVEQFTDPGDVILDATAGSGTTGVAAKKAGRRAVLIEQSEAYLLRNHCAALAAHHAADVRRWLRGDGAGRAHFRGLERGGLMATQFFCSAPSSVREKPLLADHIKEVGGYA